MVKAEDNIKNLKPNCQHIETKGYSIRFFKFFLCISPGLSRVTVGNVVFTTFYT